MIEQLLVHGHGLLNEGRAFTDGGGNCETCDVEAATGKRGHPRCSCGVLGPHLDSDAARKRWHRDHKNDILTARSGALHRCPPRQRTERATTVGKLLASLAGSRKETTRRSTLTILGAHLGHMNLNGLCPLCGFPLDNSHPYPGAVRAASGVS